MQEYNDLNYNKLMGNKTNKEVPVLPQPIPANYFNLWMFLLCVKPKELLYGINK